MEDVVKISSGPKSRRSSECDDDDRTGDAANELKSPGFIFGATACSPPKFVTLEEVMRAANSLENMALAHEIAVDAQFRLEKADVNEDDAETLEQRLYARVHREMHRAFWDILQNQLAEDPPEFANALALIGDIKEALVTKGLVQRKDGARANVESKLDMELIKQQAEAGTLNFHEYLEYIVTTMASCCAPIRDEALLEIRNSLKELRERNCKASDLVPVLRSVMETLVMMKIDMANVAIAQIRPYIQMQSAEFERKKFLEFVETVPTALSSTEAWLKRHVEKCKGAKYEEILASAYLELLAWEPSLSFPEPLAVDYQRVRDLQASAHELVLTSACLLLSFSGPVGASVQAIPSVRESLRDKISVLLSDVPSSRLDEALAGVAEVVLKELEAARKKHGHGPIHDADRTALRTQITELTSPDQQIRALLRRRLNEFLRSAIAVPPPRQLEIPPGMSVVGAELTRLATSFARLIAHNRRAFGVIYSDILDRLVVPT